MSMESREIKTQERSDYIFMQAPKEEISFKLRAPREAQIALLNKPSEAEPIYEVILGSSYNQQTVLRKNFTEVLIAVNTPNILNANKFRKFWICWRNNTLTVGSENEVFISYAYTDEEFFEVYYIGIRVGDNERGTWKFETQRKYPGPGFWIAANGGTVPPFAENAGYYNEELYISRAKHAGDLLPGYLVPSKGVCFVSYDGSEYQYANYEVFCGSGGHWEKVNDGDEIPENAIKGGNTEYGETLFLGRVQYNNATLFGKVHPSHGCCYIPYEGRELSFKDYEIFVWESFCTA